MVINKRQSSTFRQGVQTVMIDIYGKFYSQNNDATYTYCINLVEAIIRHQKLVLTWRELPTVAFWYNAKIRENYLLTSSIVFAVNKYECFMENKNMIKTFCGCKSSKNTIQPHQNFTGTGNFTKKANKLWQK